MQLIHIIRVVIVNDDHIFITIETSRKILLFRTIVEHNFAFRFRFVCVNEIEFCIIDSWLHLSNCFSKCSFSSRRRDQFVRHVNLVQKARINQIKRCDFDYFMKLSNFLDIVKEVCVVTDWIKTKSHRRSFTSKNQNAFSFANLLSRWICFSKYRCWNVNVKSLFEIRNWIVLSRLKILVAIEMFEWNEIDFFVVAFTSNAANVSVDVRLMRSYCFSIDCVLNFKTRNASECRSMWQQTLQTNQKNWCTWFEQSRCDKSVCMQWDRLFRHCICSNIANTSFDVWL